MRQRTLVIAGLAVVGAAIAVAVPMAILALQESHELRFEYVKTGGIAGINERIAFDSKTGAITFYQSTSMEMAIEKQLPDAKVRDLREAIAGSGFFAFDSVYPPRQGPADYFSYTLTVTMDGRVHSVSWVDDFATAEPVPEELGNIVGEIEQAYATAAS